MNEVERAFNFAYTAAAESMVQAHDPLRRLAAIATLTRHADQEQVVAIMQDVCRVREGVDRAWQAWQVEQALR